MQPRKHLLGINNTESTCREERGQNWFSFMWTCDIGQVLTSGGTFWQERLQTVNPSALASVSFTWRVNVSRCESEYCAHTHTHTQNGISLIWLGARKSEAAVWGTMAREALQKCWVVGLEGWGDLGVDMEGDTVPGLTVIYLKSVSWEVLCVYTRPATRSMENSCRRETLSRWASDRWKEDPSKHPHLPLPHPAALSACWTCGR